MIKRTVPQRVDKFLKKKPRVADLTAIEMDEIYNTGSAFNMIVYAFYLGYMKGMKAGKGGAAI